MHTTIERARRILAAPVDAAGLVWFRVIFGAVVAWEMGRYLSHDWVGRYWVEPKVLFPYSPLDFVQRWPQAWMMYAHVVVVLLAALAVSVGWRYRAASWVLFGGFTWLFLLDQTRYLNHFYLISLLCLVLACLPANRTASVDVIAGRAEASDTTPAWTLWLVRFMVGVPYFFGGVAKITSDWLAGEPMRDWLAGSTDYPIIGPWLDTEPAVWFFVLGGLFFDLLVVPLLLWRRTRPLGLGLSVAFHLLNSRLFKIGVFPWMMLLATLVFLPPDWPRRVWSDIRGGSFRSRVALAGGAASGMFVASELPSQPSFMNVIIGGIAVAVLCWEYARYGWDHDRPLLPEPAARPLPALPSAVLAGWVALHLLVPLRHFAIPGDVHWTEQGHRWSWHMKLRDKDVERFRVRVDPPGDAKPFVVKPRDYLAKHQVDKVASSPEMTLQFARWLVEELKMPGAAVYVDADLSLNGRPAALLFDPEADLAKAELGWWSPPDWILPLTEPLPGRTGKPHWARGDDE